jgi:methyl-accepting chemotaxis protein
VEFDKEISAGELSFEAAQKQALSVIKTMRYGSNEYFGINDLEPKMIMHPFKPELNGKDLSENKDPNGKHLFVEMAQVCKEKKAGFVDYMWEKPGASIPIPKISYVKLFTKWDGLLGPEYILMTLKKKFLL